MPADESAPTPNRPWTLNDLPIVVGWPTDDGPTLLAGPETDRDPWTAPGGGEPWGVLHVIVTAVSVDVERRSGKEATLRRLAATARAHGWRWLPAATARPDSSHSALGIAVHGLPRATAVDLGRGAGQRMALELTAERLRLLDLAGGQITTVRRHHLPRIHVPPWLSTTSELLTVWRQRHRLALDPIGAAGPPTDPSRPDQSVQDQPAKPSCSERR